MDDTSKKTGTAPRSPKRPGNGTSRPKGSNPGRGGNHGKKKKKKGKRRSPALRLLRAIMLIASILVAAATVVTAYSGDISPLKSGGFWGILPLCFPMILLAAICLIVLQIWWHWRGVIIVALGLLASASPALSVCPLHIHFGERRAPDGSDKFTLLSYNTFNFNEQRDSTDTDTPNRMLDYVIQTNADIVCLQEAYLPAVSPQQHITAEQVQKLHSLYPYIITNGHRQTILSKYPVQPLHLSLTKEEFDDADLAAYRLTFPSGRSATIFNVHLQSLSLTTDDRELYLGLTDLERRPISNVRQQLIHKLSVANVERARQSQALLRFIRHYGGPDVIVCGDFNDVVTCYAIQQLRDAGFHDLYATIGFGPIITYNSDRLYFGIDHILYRGDFVPLDIEKGTLKASDHYPLLATIALKPSSR